MYFLLIMLGGFKYINWKKKSEFITIQYLNFISFYNKSMGNNQKKPF